MASDPNFGATCAVCGTEGHWSNDCPHMQHLDVDDVEVVCCENCGHEMEFCDSDASGIECDGCLHVQGDETCGCGCEGNYAKG